VYVESLQEAVTSGDLNVLIVERQTKGGTVRRLKGVLFLLALLITGQVVAQETITVITASSALPKWEIAARVAEEKLGIHIDIVSQGYNETRQKIVTALAAGSSAYDIIITDTIWLPEFAEAGWLIPLDDRITKAYWEDGTEAWQQLASYKGDVYLIGAGYNAKIMLVNTNLLNQAGFDNPATTWEELVQQAKEMQRLGLVQYGIAWGWTEAEGLVCDYTLLLNAFGGKFQDANGNWVVNSEEAIQTLQFMVDTLHTDKVADPASVTLSDREVLQQFLAGDIPYVLSWTFGWSWAMDPNRSHVVDAAQITLIPGTRIAGTRSSTTGGGSGYGISAFSRNKDLAWEVLQIYGSPEVEFEFAKEIHLMAFTRKSVALNPEYLEMMPEAEIFLEQLKYNYSRPKFPQYAEFSAILQRQIHRALLREVSPKEALDEAQQQIMELIGL